MELPFSSCSINVCNRKKESGCRETREIQMGWEILELFLSLIYFSYMRGQRMPS